MFTAKVLSAGGAYRSAPVSEAVPGSVKPVDYNVLMERSFGEAVHAHEDKPPLPENPSHYLL